MLTRGPPVLSINLDSISDKATRDALESLLKALNSITFLKGKWEMIDVKVKGNGEFIFPHNLNSTPKDVIVTYQDSTGVVTFNRSKFDRTKISVTVSGVTPTSYTTLRAFIGQYQEG